ncbi:MAG: NADH-quinone oxidoreductase subunit H [Cyclobacteriaceae bacterium]|nr:NADH-quinone oxidoreductase subunit H [Cyclobacteriaceae bacterium]
MSTLFFILPFLLLYTLFVIYAERKISAFIQDRLGPMETGPYGLMQSVADFIKLIQKEDIVPAKADQWLFKIAPFIIFLAVFVGFAVIPLGPAWSGAGISSGVFFLLAIVSLDVIGIMIAGWSSNNKYSTLGTFRAAAQIISYEVPLGLSVLCVCMVCQTLDLQEISYQQSHGYSGEQFFLGVSSWGQSLSAVGGFLSWNVFRMPLLFIAWIVFFISSLAEANRAPFDLPIAESELVSGYHTEYSGFRWASIMLSEYAMMLLVSVLGTVLFFGSWATALPDLGPVRLGTWTSGVAGTWSVTAWAIFWLILKSLFFVALQIWVRWTFPRLRIDQLMKLSWKYLTPVGLALVILCGFWRLYIVL